MTMANQHHDVASVTIDLTRGKVLKTGRAQIVSADVIPWRDHRPEALCAALPARIHTRLDQIALQALPSKIRVHHTADQLGRGVAHRLDLVVRIGFVRVVAAESTECAVHSVPSDRSAPSHRSVHSGPREIQHCIGDQACMIGRMFFDTQGQMRRLNVVLKETRFVGFTTIVIRVGKVVQHALAQRVQCRQLGDIQGYDAQGAW